MIWDITSNLVRRKRVIAVIQYKDGSYGSLKVNKDITVNMLLDLAIDNEWKILTITSEEQIDFKQL